MHGKRAIGYDNGAAKRPCAGDTDSDEDQDDNGLTMNFPEDPRDGLDPGRSTPTGTLEKAAAPPPPAPAFSAPTAIDPVAVVASWGRPSAALETIAASPERALSVQVVELDYHTDVGGIDAHEARAVLRIFGVTLDGVSVLMNVSDFKPYFYVQVPTLVGKGADDAARVCLPLLTALNCALQKPDHAWDYVSKSAVAVLPLARRSIRNYCFEESVPFLKVVLALPSLVAPCRQLLEDGLVLQLPPRSDGEGGGSFELAFATFESNCAFALRFMVDLGLVGCGWVSATGGRWTPRTTGARTSRCQLEVDVATTDLMAHPTTDPKWMTVAPMRLLSFDIECLGRDGIFPEAEHDPVIQIANYVQVQGETSPAFAVIFTLGTCSPTGCGAQVLAYDSEAALLRAWAFFVRCADPDLLTGYNIVNFDLPYLLDRAQALGLADFPYLGRVTATKTRAKEKVFQSKQTGARKSKEINVEGCVVFDAFVLFQRDERLSSLSLNSVSFHFLGDQKEDVPHTAISGLQRGTPDDRRRLAVYCLKDARLPLRLLDARMKVVNYVEMARVTGVPLSYLLTRGQQIKVMSMLYRKCLPLGLVLPVARDRVEGAKYEGATVIDPVKGFYKDEPIATLDFASLVSCTPLNPHATYCAAARTLSSLAVWHIHTVCLRLVFVRSTRACVFIELPTPFPMRPLGATPTHALPLPSPSATPSRSMQAHNLCYSTLLRSEDVHLLPPEDVTKSPTGDCFVKASRRKGVLPAILEELLAARKQAKRDMAAAKGRGDGAAAAVYDGRQLALKISANSVYGCALPLAPLLPLAPTPTAYSSHHTPQLHGRTGTRHWFNAHTRWHVDQAVVCLHTCVAELERRWNLKTLALLMHDSAQLHVPTQIVTNLCSRWRAGWPAAVPRDRRYCHRLWSRDDRPD